MKLPKALNRFSRSRRINNIAWFRPGLETLMRKLAKIAVILMGTSLLAACNTVEGAGKDIEAGGKSIQKGAEAVKKKL